MSGLKGSSENYFNKLSSVISQLDHSHIDNACNLVEKAWVNGKQIITLGNGGSALTSLHFINDWNKSIYLASGKPLRGRSLVDNIGLVTSYANDISYQDIFIEQLKNIQQPGDLIIAISGSGNSENVVRAVQYANDNGAITLGLTGYDGGKLLKLVQHSVWVPVNDMQLVEDIHMMFGHIVMQKFCGYA